jgi:hypothetical protein
MPKLTINQQQVSRNPAMDTQQTLRILSASELITAFQNLIDTRPFTDTGVKLKNLQALSASVAMQAPQVRRAVAKIKDVLKTFATAQATASVLFTEQDAKELRSEYRTAVKNAITELRLVPANPEAGLAMASFSTDQLRSNTDVILSELERDPEFKRFKIVTGLSIIMTNLFDTKLEEVQKYYKTYDFHGQGYYIIGNQAVLAYRDEAGISAEQKVHLARQTLNLINDKHGTGYAIVGDKYIKTRAQGVNIIYFWIMRETIMTRLVSKHVFTDKTEWVLLSSRFNDEHFKKQSSNEPPTLLPERKLSKELRPSLPMEAIEVMFGILADTIKNSTAAPSLETFVRRVNVSPRFRKFKVTVSIGLLEDLIFNRDQKAKEVEYYSTRFLQQYQQKYHVTLYPPL